MHFVLFVLSLRLCTIASLRLICKFTYWKQKAASHPAGEADPAYPVNFYPRRKIMKYPELIQRLFSINLFSGMKFGLENALRLDEALKFPSKSFFSAHVAGTNGKGSVTKKMASAFQEAGFRVGCYISPHISCFRERISINGKMIPEETVERLLSKIFLLIDERKIPATFFEITTLLAFTYFAEEKVDWAVIETGLGGRLDATNIINPKISVITSISLEHTEHLGNTIAEIAYEKAGIIKPQIPVVLGPRLPNEIFEEIAKQNNSLYTKVSGHFDTFEEENGAIAKAALEVLEISSLAIQKGLKSRLPCRFEEVKIPQSLRGKPIPKKIILDVAHNPDGLKELFRAIRKDFPNDKLRVVCGLSKTKDIISCLEILKQHACFFHLIEATNGRAYPAVDLKDALIKLKVSKNSISVYDKISEGVLEAIIKAGEMELVIICGTFFIMGEARAALGIIEPHDEFDMNERVILNTNKR
jgi:dihydrofolate synthase/folylpolyglutamate synthase